MLTALMLAGRVGSGIAAELGSMVVTDQINALRALGTDPIRKLVVPRVLAGIVMAPVLTVIANTVGMLGGWIIAVHAAAGGVGRLLDVGRRRACTSRTSGWGCIKPFFLGFVIVTDRLPRRAADDAAARRASAGRRPTRSWPPRSA